MLVNFVILPVVGCKVLKSTFVNFIQWRWLYNYSQFTILHFVDKDIYKYIYDFLCAY